MRYNLTTLTSAQIPTAVSAEVGNETMDVKFTASPFYLMGSVRVTGDQVGDSIWSPSAGVSLPVAGRDLHLRCSNEIVGAAGGGSLTVVLNVTYDDDVVGTSTATIGIPAWSSIQDNIFARCTASDFVADSAGDADKLIKSIQGVASVNNTLAGNEFEIIASPPASEFYEIGCAVNKDISFPVAKPVPVACGDNPARWNKSGRPEIPNMTIGYKYISSREDLNRVNGHRVGVLVETVKDKSVPFENHVCIGFLVSVTNPRGETAEDEVTATSEGTFENLMIFAAL